MKIWKEPFGTAKEGKEASKYFLQNRNGTTAVLTDFGVTLLSLTYAGKDVILGYDSLRDYETQTEYLGATVGRFAGPLPEGKLLVGENLYSVTLNNGEHHIHGGTVGFSFRVWDAEILPDGVKFSLFSPDGEEGFPGNLGVSVTCRLTEEDGLQYIYDAVSDRDTVLNMTCHGYFNLEGHEGGAVLDHTLQSPAAWYREEEPAGIPKTVVFPVEGTPFDFRKPHTFAENMEIRHPQLDSVFGYDRNGYLGQSGVWKRAALVEAPKSGITMEVLTTQTGMQLYCPGTLLVNHPGKCGVTYQAYHAFCIETQHCLSTEEAEQGILYPVLPAGKPYHHETVYQFTRRNGYEE